MSRRHRDDYCDDLLCWCRQRTPEWYGGIAARFTPDYPPPRFDAGPVPAPPWRRATDLGPAP